MTDKRRLPPRFPTLESLANHDTDSIRSVAPPPEDDPDFRLMLSRIQSAMVMKKNMMAKRIRVAKAKCPECSGWWQAAIRGPKNHISIRCDGDCRFAMME